MKKKIYLLIFVLLISCSPDFKNNFEVIKNDKSYKMLICYYNDSKDSVSIDWLLSYQINNKTNRGIKFNRIRKRPEYSVQTALMKPKDSLEMFNRLVQKKSSRELILYCTKIVARINFPEEILIPEESTITYGEFEKNVTHIPKEQLAFFKSSFFQKIIKEKENDSIAIVFRDTVSDDYFEFNGVIKDRVLKYSKWK